MPTQIPLPLKKCPERSKAIVDAVREGNHHPIGWSAIRSSILGMSAVFLVMSDALMMDVIAEPGTLREAAGERVRVNVTEKDARAIAEILGCVLPTAKIADLIYDQADARVLPKLMSGPGQDLRHMMDTTWMIDHSQRIDKSLPGIASIMELSDLEQSLLLPYVDRLSSLVSTVGKHWIIDAKIVGSPMAANYGWHFPGNEYGGVKGELRVTGHGRLVQGIGTRHNKDHTDYSQTCQLVHKKCLVGNTVMDVLDVLSHGALYKLGAHWTAPIPADALMSMVSV